MRNCPRSRQQIVCFIVSPSAIRKFATSISPLCPKSSAETQSTMSAWSAVAMFVGSNSRNAPNRRKTLAHDEVEQPLNICDSCSFELFPLAHQQRTEVWARIRCRVGVNRRNRKTACASVSICGRDIFFREQILSRPQIGQALGATGPKK